MSEDEARTTGQEDEQQEEVEGHGRKSFANEEAGDEAAGDDDVEGHMRRTT
jgi:hypothetical protein